MVARDHNAGAEISKSGKPARIMLENTLEGSALAEFRRIFAGARDVFKLSEEKYPHPHA